MPAAVGLVTDIPTIRAACPALPARGEVMLDMVLSSFSSVPLLRGCVARSGAGDDEADHHVALVPDPHGAVGAQEGSLDQVPVRPGGVVQGPPAAVDEQPQAGVSRMGLASG
jgi:hypothetical protein